MQCAQPYRAAPPPTVSAMLDSYAAWNNAMHQQCLATRVYYRCCAANIHSCILAYNMACRDEGHLEQLAFTDARVTNQEAVDIASHRGTGLVLTALAHPPKQAQQHPCLHQLMPIDGGAQGMHQLLQLLALELLQSPAQQHRQQCLAGLKAQSNSVWQRTVHALAALAAAPGVPAIGM